MALILEVQSYRRLETTIRIRHCCCWFLNSTQLISTQLNR